MEYIKTLNSLNDMWISIKETISTVWEALSPILKSLWDIILKVINSGVGTAILNVINQVITFLDKLGLLDDTLWILIGTWMVLKGMQLVSWFSGIALSITNLQMGVTSLTGVFGILAGAIAIVTAIDLISNWNELSTFAKVLKLALIGVSVALFAVAIAGTSMWSALTMGIAAAAIVATIAVVASQITATQDDVLSNINGYSTGGEFEKGDYFKANENGKTELITSSNSGGGTVMTQEQWANVTETAFLNALYTYGAATANGQQIIINLDGAEVARSKRLKGELNRTNPKLNLV